MITADGYSKDPNIVPEGIVITWSKEMIEEGYGSLWTFIDHFFETMENDEGIWLQKCRNKPQYDNLLYVYIIYKNRLRYRANFVGFERGDIKCFDAHGAKNISWSRVLMTGPLVKNPTKRKLKGFQGFRYCTKLF